MSHLETRIKKLETGSADSDLADFLTALYTDLQPNAPAPNFESCRGQSVKDFIANCKTLRPKMPEDAFTQTG